MVRFPNICNTATLKIAKIIHYNIALLHKYSVFNSFNQKLPSESGCVWRSQRSHWGASLCLSLCSIVFPFTIDWSKVSFAASPLESAHYRPSHRDPKHLCWHRSTTPLLSQCWEPRMTGLLHPITLGKWIITRTILHVWGSWGSHVWFLSLIVGDVLLGLRLNITGPSVVSQVHFSSHM